MYFVYILLCKDKSFYTGITQDVEKRFLLHKSGAGAKYTRAKTPIKIVYTERKCNRSYALKREAAIKRLSKAEKVRLVSSFEARS